MLVFKSGLTLGKSISTIQNSNRYWEGKRKQQKTLTPKQFWGAGFTMIKPKGKHSSINLGNNVPTKANANLSRRLE